MLFSTNRVLVPIDFSEESFQALKLTLEYLKDSSKLSVIYVLNHLSVGEPGLVWEKINDQTRVNHVKQAFYQRVNQQEYPEIHFQVKIGDPSSEIIDFANKNQIELIVIPSHGRTGVERFFLGSVAEKVVRFAHCPVLVLRRKQLLNYQL